MRSAWQPYPKIISTATTILFVYWQDNIEEKVAKMRENFTKMTSCLQKINFLKRMEHAAREWIDNGKQSKHVEDHHAWLFCEKPANRDALNKYIKEKVDELNKVRFGSQESSDEASNEESDCDDSPPTDEQEISNEGKNNTLTWRITGGLVSVNAEASSVNGDQLDDGVIDFQLGCDHQALSNYRVNDNAAYFRHGNRFDGFTCSQCGQTLIPTRKNGRVYACPMTEKGTCDHMFCEKCYSSKLIQIQEEQPSSRMRRCRK